MDTKIRTVFYRQLLGICFLTVFPLLAVGQGVEGKVTGCNDFLPLAGVSVQVEGTNVGTSTGD
ncbi:MAG: carboxypeptidase-like regulatory domain-containing protein, partial [Tannerella sp.]|nr:carboxypeptidase-like regulatory domain-containing protein [Tannerella sp.]